MLMKLIEIYYDWNSDGLSTNWLGREREKNYIYRRVYVNMKSCLLLESSKHMKISVLYSLLYSVLYSEL